MEQPIWNVEYADAEGNVKEMELKPKFLTPKLRVEIIKHDAETQKMLKLVDKENLSSDFAKRQKELVNKMNAKLEEYMTEHPDATDEQIEYQKAIITAEFSSNMSEEDIDEGANTNAKIWVTINNSAIRFFKLITNTLGLSPEDRKLFDSKEDSDFWQNANATRIGEMNTFFRQKYIK